jgi:hypothetical protein
VVTRSFMGAPYQIGKAAGALQTAFGAAQVFPLRSRERSEFVTKL